MTGIKQNFQTNRKRGLRFFREFYAIGPQFNRGSVTEPVFYFRNRFWNHSFSPSIRRANCRGEDIFRPRNYFRFHYFFSVNPSVAWRPKFWATTQPTGRWVDFCPCFLPTEKIFYRLFSARLLVLCVRGQFVRLETMPFTWVQTLFDYNFICAILLETVAYS